MVDKGKEIEIKGCPVADGQPPCHMCGGGWPGTKASSKKLIEAARQGRLKPEKLGCGLLIGWVTRALEETPHN